MRVIPNRRRYGPEGIEPVESFVSCALCGEDIPRCPAFLHGLPVHPACLERLGDEIL
ncbi:MAG: hypothetical protein K2O18_02140 [Oscillospiraceae bacterium]|nr:hypothetical protein [Oscillospiraceae bacterium]